MNKHLVMSKGYTLRVVSWENDGDRYITKDIKCENIEYIQDVIAFINLFNSNDDSYGNMLSYKFYSLSLIYDAIVKCPTLFGDKYERYVSELCEIIKHEMASEINEQYSDLELMTEFLTEISDEHEIVNEISDFIIERSTEFLDVSEFYMFRVYDSHEVFYTSEDLYCDVIDCSILTK